jgi:peptidoglycan/xylan/chitin deacetylase (PgdA/CDA1 family)
VPVLCWHQIRAATARDSASDRTYIVSPKTLAAQLAALDRAGYHPVTGQALVAHVALGKPLPPKPVLLTFDDASAGQYTRALPLLRRHHFVATFFVMTVVLDKPGWLTSRQVRQLDRDGMTIAPHTYDHHAVPQYRGEDWHTQLVAPAAKLEKLVGHPVRLFAYPFGLWSPEAFAHLDDAGYVAAFQLAGKLDRRHPCGRCGASSCRSSPAASCCPRSSETSSPPLGQHAAWLGRFKTNGARSARPADPPRSYSCRAEVA